MQRRMLAAVISAALGVLILAAPVAAFPLTNCSLQANSVRADGSALDSIQSGAPDATQDDPFIVDWDGTISYQGNSQIEMKNNTWAVAVFGIPTPLSGGSPNEDDNREGSGTVGVSANAPFRFTGLYYVSGSLTGSGGTCAGSGWFKLAGDPIGTIPFFVALGVLGVGIAMLVAGARGHAITGIVGGVLTGLGTATMLVLYSTLPMGSPTPLIVLLLGAILGVVVTLIGRRSAGSDTPPMMPPTNAPPTEAPPAV